MKEDSKVWFYVVDPTRCRFWSDKLKTKLAAIGQPEIDKGLARHQIDFKNPQLNAEENAGKVVLWVELLQASTRVVDYEFAVIHEADFGIMGPRTKEFDRCRATAVWATCSNFRTTQGTARTVEAVIRDDKTLTVKDADGLFIESLDSALKSDYRNTFLEKAGVAYIVLIPNDPFAFPKLFGVTKKTDLGDGVYELSVNYLSIESWLLAMADNNPDLKEKFQAYAKEAAWLGGEISANSEVRIGLAPEIENVEMLFIFLQHGAHLGAEHSFRLPTNGVEITFSVRPWEAVWIFTAESELVMQFDITRQVESFERNIRLEEAQTTIRLKNLPKGDEWVNDEIAGLRGTSDYPFASPFLLDLDNDILPRYGTGKIFSLDSPGCIFNIVPLPDLRGIEQTLNAYEFVRVKFGGKFVQEAADDNFTHPPQGSRCSDKVQWKSSLRVQAKKSSEVPDVAKYHPDLDEEVYIKDKSVTSIGRVQP